MNALFGFAVGDLGGHFSRNGWAEYIGLELGEAASSGVIMDTSG